MQTPDGPITGEWTHRYEITDRAEGCVVTYECSWCLDGASAIHEGRRRLIFRNVVLPIIWEAGLRALVDQAERENRRA
jgi:hypothetical protein